MPPYKTDKSNNGDLYKRMIEEIQDYAIILLDKNGIIQNWNIGAEKIKQYTEEEIVGKHFSIFYFSEDIENGLPQRLLKQASENGRAIYEGWRKRKDNSRFWGSIAISAIHDDANNIIGYCKVTRDLTQQKITEEKINAYTAELEIQNSELEQFAYVASHDLQEPLRKITIFSELIQENYEDKELVQKYFAKLDSSALRMSELIKSLLNFSRISKDKLKVECINLNDIVQEVKNDFELLIEEKDATIISATLPVFKGNRVQIGQLFSNLISNSLKFCKEKPVIRILSNIIPKKDIPETPALLTEDYYCQINFEDNGIGFDQQYDKVIFSLFQRLHGRQDYAGTGIGLALCKKVVENHRGMITAISEPGKGAKFIVYLPAIDCMD